MAIVGHWLGAFPVCYFVPQASVALMCKLSMMADTLAALFLVLKIEDATTYAWYMSTPPPASMETFAKWKASGEWLYTGPVFDGTPGEAGFNGYSVLWPMYLNLKYSHTVEFMAILGVIIAAYMRLRYSISIGYALGIMFAIVSHPVMDMFFHDATLLMGNRAVTRCCFHFWQTPWMGPISFALEMAMAYFGYRLWMSKREPIDGDSETLSSISYYNKMFWTLSIQHNMLGFYVLSPFMIYGFSSWAPQLQAFTPAAYWSFVLFAIVIWSWAFALYPLHKIEALTVIKKPTMAREADWYIKAP